MKPALRIDDYENQLKVVKTARRILSRCDGLCNSLYTSLQIHRFENDGDCDPYHKMNILYPRIYAHKPDTDSAYWFPSNNKDNPASYNLRYKILTEEINYLQAKLRENEQNNK